MEPGTTIGVHISESRDGYLKADPEGMQFSISGEGYVGQERKVRVVRHC